ncbi:glycerate kinase [Endozoicomonas numazuensis]|uniref:Glycerate kinase n=1 Tax=Endozoicomonas numazuensis TaxID=1137799 RepID=A0A081NGZ6_9GAMM|nr:glycerate kinase [Endozoicomonas numazuensis]KEQ17719.1 glycerate kinase [Endozoicomonas numazuensis]
MKIVIAPDSFKECLTAAQVASAIETGFKEILPDAEYIKVPVADGGEGTLQSLVDATGGRLIEVPVTGPLGNQIHAEFGVLGDGKTAVIEMARASGLELVSPEQRNPMIATTFGTGELIHSALDIGVEKIIVGIGGSATNDGGAGMMQALGVRLQDEEGKELRYGGGQLKNLCRIDVSKMDQRLKSVEFIAACDVDNPLTGENGASAIFGPQKGATAEMIKALDQSLEHYAQMMERELGISVLDVPGAGAAGGMGAALLGYLNARLEPGIEIVMEAVDLAEKIKGANLVITGEGRIDGQTAQGKTPVGVARIAKSVDLPVVALAGSVGQGVDAVYSQGIDALFPVVHGAVSLEQALKKGKENLVRAARNLAAVVTMKL